MTWDVSEDVVDAAHSGFVSFAAGFEEHDPSYLFGCEAAVVKVDDLFPPRDACSGPGPPILCSQVLVG